jgi:hypothetical protein
VIPEQGIYSRRPDVSGEIPRQGEGFSLEEQTRATYSENKTFSGSLRFAGQVFPAVNVGFPQETCVGMD